MTYQSSVALYVDAALVVGDEDPSSAAEVRTTVLPSVAELVRSDAVLAEVADTLRLPDSPAELAAGLDVVTERRTSVLRITATPVRAGPRPSRSPAPSGPRSGRAGRGAAMRAPDGSLLQVTLVRSSSDAASTARSVTVLACSVRVRARARPASLPGSPSWSAHGSADGATSPASTRRRCSPCCP